MQKGEDSKMKSEWKDEERTTETNEAKVMVSSGADGSGCKGGRMRCDPPGWEGVEARGKWTRLVVWPKRGAGGRRDGDCGEHEDGETSDV